MREETREEWAAAVDQKVLRWLALLPEWTGSLAVDCAFPAGTKGIETTIEEARAALLCDVSRGSDLIGGETVRFWMPSTMRTWLFERWQLQTDVRLEEEVQEIASRILEAHRRLQPVSSGILHWARLAEAELAKEVVTGEPLSDLVREALATENLVEAGEWLFAAEWLSKPLGAVMEMAASRAQRQISLHHLRAQDADYLTRFLPRPEQLAELEKVAASEKEWGVHFVGLSGVGKTMLMRFISSRLENNPFARSSRIDFDYLDPRIPLERPARLLQELGEGFAMDLETGAQESLFKSFLEALRTAESAREEMSPDTFGLVAGTRQFQQAVEAFGLFLNSLPQPVALILDTCEELAKLHPPGGQMWSVNATFDILQLLREVVPGLKLIVAGRRWLTAKYANEERELPAPVEISSAPPREFLRFHETRGFIADEVRVYLSEVRRLDLPEGLVTTLLDSCHDEAGVPGVQRREGEEPRFNPTEIAFYATLLKENPELGRKAVEDGNFDSYVTERILKRLKDTPELVGVFPAAAILERFDAAVIEPVLGETPAGRRALLARLIAEDWTHLEGGPEPEEIVLKVDPGLLPRLRDYYDGTHGRRSVREEMRRKLQKHLAAKLEGGPPGATVEVVDAAVRLLPLELAVEKLETATERVVERGAWGWAEAVGQRLLDLERDPERDSDSDDPRAPLRAAIWILYLTGMKHSQAKLDFEQLWKGVEKLLPRHPDEKQRKLLLVRSRLNAVAAAAADGELDLEPASTGLLFDEGRRLLGKPGGEMLVSALLGAAEKLIDAREEHGSEIPVAAVSRSLLALPRHLKETRPLQAHLAALRGRLYTLEEELSSASNAFTEVALLVRGAEEAVPFFADWEAPSSPTGRAMLELLRFRLATGERGEGLLSRGEEMAYRTTPGADSAQLLSLVLQARIAAGSLTVAKLERAGIYERRLESYHRTAPAHRTAPPLFVSVAHGWMRCGEMERGLKLLRARERLATSLRTDERSASAAAMALLSALRQLRLREGLTLASHLIGVDEEQRAEAMAAGVLIAGLQPTQHRAAEDDHATWRVRNLLELSAPTKLLSPQGAEVDRADGPKDVHRLLDLLESELVRQRWEGRGEESELAVALEERLWDAAMAFAPAPSLSDSLGCEEMRLRLRFAALLDDSELVAGTDLQAQLGRIALEEGELLALRLPDRAVRPLTIAGQCFAEIGDNYWALVADLRTAIAEIHAGQAEKAAYRRRQILQRYEILREERPGLPALGALLDRDTRELIENDDPWRGWIWRLVFYLRWCEGRGGGPRATATAMEYGPEFTLWAATGVEQGGRAMGRGMRRRRLAVQSPTLYRWLPILPALVALVALGLGTTFLLTLGAIAVIALGLVAIEKVGPQLPRRVLPLSGFDLSLISLNRLGEGPSIQTYGFVAAQPRAKLLPLRLYLLALKRWRDVEYSTIPTGGDLAGGAKLPENVGQALRRTLLGHYLPLRLEVGSDLAWVSWERILLSRFTGDPDWNPSRSPQVLRVRPRGFPAPQPIWSGRIAAVCTPRWRQFLEKSSKGKAQWLTDLSALGAEPAAARPPVKAVGLAGDAPTRAGIALGVAVETKAGWRLRLDEDRLSEPLLAPSEPQMQQLVGPEALARKFPLVVLVPPPGGDPAAAGSPVSEGLRSLANEIHLAGAHGVITLPVLPPGVAAWAIDILVRRFESWQDLPDEDGLRRCVERVRSCVFEGARRSTGGLGDEDEEDDARLWRVELTLDVCLFGPRPKRGR